MNGFQGSGGGRERDQDGKVEHRLLGERGDGNMVSYRRGQWSNVDSESI